MTSEAMPALIEADYEALDPRQAGRKSTCWERRAADQEELILELYSAGSEAAAVSPNSAMTAPNYCNCL